MFLMLAVTSPSGLINYYSLKYGTFLSSEHRGTERQCQGIRSCERKGNGFRFDQYDSRRFLKALDAPWGVFRRVRSEWRTLMRNAMTAD